MRSVTWNWLAQKYNSFVVTAKGQAVTKKKKNTIQSSFERDPQNMQSYLTNWYT